ncbi:uncharacterized protein LOC133194941 [Saccostrea echinata]|uniref:uncharacterized protein LOC133194941 n=1 Tax=Saccostrea echinata TaxID=191078 RepID=UPI002A7FEB4E|nr:uncharacterized protein LOC133194941 [Saccostrea echinata]
MGQKTQRYTKYKMQSIKLAAKVFDISPQQQQWLTNHLGHTVDVHKIHYRQISGVIEPVDISKLVLLTVYGLTVKNACRKLTDITLEEYWMEAKLKEVHEYFRECLNTNTTPGRKDCNMAIEKNRANEGAIQYRPWESLKKKVWSIIQKQKINHFDIFYYIGLKPYL